MNKLYEEILANKTTASEYMKKLPGTEEKSLFDASVRLLGVFTAAPGVSPNRILDHLAKEDDGMKMVNYGLQFVGNRYKYGGTSLTNGTDCSGFIYSVYRHFGYNVPRLGFYKMGKGVCLDEAKAGDVVYYPGHYAMYMGDGKIVHAYNSRAGSFTPTIPAQASASAMSTLREGS